MPVLGTLAAATLPFIQGVMALSALTLLLLTVTVLPFHLKELFTTFPRHLTAGHFLLAAAATTLVFAVAGFTTAPPRDAWFFAAAGTTSFIGVLCFAGILFLGTETRSTATSFTWLSTTAYALYLIAAVPAVTGTIQTRSLVPVLQTGPVFLVVGGVAALYTFKTREPIRNIPTSTIRSLPQGHLVEINGTATQNGECATSDGDACVVNRCTVKRYMGRGRHSKYWHTLCDTVTPPVFAVDDGTGEVQVDTAGAEFHVTERWKTVTADSASEEENAWLQEKGVTLGEPAGFWSIGPVNTVQIREQTIPPDSDVYVLGQATTRDGQACMVRDDEHNTYVIADEKEEELVNDLKQMHWIHIAAAVTGFVFTAVLVLA